MHDKRPPIKPNSVFLSSLTTCEADLANLDYLIPEEYIDVLTTLFDDTPQVRRRGCGAYKVHVTVTNPCCLYIAFVPLKD